MKISTKYFHVEISLRRILPAMGRKLMASGWRVVDIFRLLPIRIFRLIRHVYHAFVGIYRIFFSTYQPVLSGPPPRGQHFRAVAYDGIFWWLEAYLLILDCVGISEIYETLLEWVKFNSRPLYDWEVQLARSVFDQSIHYDRVRIDEYAIGGPKQMHFAYVSFYHINSWGAMHNSLLIHELVHVWQYEQVGAIYLIRALRAQRTREGYNYGGIAGLILHRQLSGNIFGFNYEQQGDLVADYFRIQQGYAPQWGRGGRSDLAHYEFFIEQIKHPHHS